MSRPEGLSAQEVYGLRISLAERIGKNAEVIDQDTGFIRCINVNVLTTPDILRDSASVVTWGFLKRLHPDLTPNKVIAVQSHGVQFQTAIGLEADLLMPHSERRDHSGSPLKPEVTYDHERGIVVVKGVPSVSKRGLYFDHVIFGLVPGETVVVADDFCATGTATNIYRGMEQLGIKPVFVYMVAKDFPDIKEPQIGYRLLKQEGVAVYASTILTDLLNGRVRATAVDVSGDF